jgi:hypothetical protein
VGAGAPAVRARGASGKCQCSAWRRRRFETLCTAEAADQKEFGHGDWVGEGRAYVNLGISLMCGRGSKSRCGRYACRDAALTDVCIQTRARNFAKRKEKRVTEPCFTLNMQITDTCLRMFFLPSWNASYLFSLLL